MLTDYYLSDPRLTLVPIEHLSPAGMSAELAALLAAERGWTAARVALFDSAFTLYWERTGALACRSRHWAPPRLRHVAIVHDMYAVRPYAQLLNTSAWTVYSGDFDPARSNPELAAYLLVHGDRMAQTGEVTQAAVFDAAYWLERSDEECRLFTEAADRSARPDADAWRALAAALPWLRQLHHETLRPPPAGAGPMRAIPGSGLLVPRVHEAQPPALITRWTTAAQEAVTSYHRLWQRTDAKAATALCAWLRTSHPPVLISAGDRIVWDPSHPDRLGALRAELRSASGAAVADVMADLDVVAARTGAFHAALATPEDLAQPDPALAQSGYTFVHPTRRLITYNLHEPGMERLRGPALPYARAMLGARTIHEWAHLAVDAGWVPCVREPAAMDLLMTSLATLLERNVNPSGKGEHPGGSALAQLLVTRLPDFQANLLAQRFLTAIERETYVRHNIRTLRGMYPAGEWWRALIRYLVEYQYLRFSAVSDRRSFFLRSTWFDDDFIATGIVDADGFDALAAAVADICDTYAVDEQRFRNS